MATPGKTGKLGPPGDLPLVRALGARLRGDQLRKQLVINGRQDLSFRRGAEFLSEGGTVGFEVVRRFEDGDLVPALLAGLIDSQLQEGRYSTSINLDGARRTVSILETP